MLLVVALLAWPAAEIFVMIEVADAIGVLAMVLLLIASWPIGVWVMRSRGRAAWRRLADAVLAGRPPGREVLDGALVLLGGALLVVPGFIADALGTLVLLPPARRALRSLIVRNLRNKLLVDVARFTRTRSTGDVDSTAREVDQPKLPR
jgi:UPF0716 protein FxsA